MNDTQLTDSLKQLLDHPGKLLELAVAKGLPTAIWRLPHGEQAHMIIDLRPEQETVFNDLESLPSGFVINPFHNHHPANPSLVKADLHLTWDLSDQSLSEVKINPALSSAELDKLSDNSVAQKPEASSETTDPDSEEYPSIVAAAIEAIKADQFTKVVLSRYDDQELPAGFDLVDFFHKACDSYPNAFTYILYSPQHGTWTGATPETLLSQNEFGIFKTVSLAGTQRLDDKSLSEVAWTQKDIEEQAMVSRYIIDCFKKIRLREFDEIGPKTAQAGNLAHLKTEYIVDTQAVNMEGLASTMLHLLHPTSAVCGMPLEPALDFIKKREHYDRELYAGFIGPVNLDNQINLFVNLRCMKLIDEHQARFFAGAGITEDSNPEKEFIETQMKMNTLKRLMFA